MGGIHFFALACGHLSGSFVDFWSLLQVGNLFFFPFLSDTISSFQFFLVPFGLAVGDRDHRPFRPSVGGGVQVGTSSLCQGPTFIIDPGGGLHGGGFRFLGRTAQCFQFGVRQFGTGQVSFDKGGGVMVGGGRGSVRIGRRRDEGGTKGTQRGEKLELGGFKGGTGLKGGKGLGPVKE